MLALNRHGTTPVSREQIFPHKDIRKIRECLFVADSGAARSNVKQLR
jgi:hypothetical protein